MAGNREKPGSARPEGGLEWSRTRWESRLGRFGAALGIDLLGNPDLVATVPMVSFKTALWFWMTAQPPKPSCHDVMIGQFRPSAQDVAAGRKPGFGLTVNIINGGIECNKPTPAQVTDRVGFYQRHCELLAVTP